MNIILLGPPGAGKGTQADFICQHLHIPKISTGDMVRATIAKDDDFGRNLKEIVNSGRLVSDEIIITMLKTRIAAADCDNGFLLDGFPRTINQAEALQMAGVKISYVIQLQVADAEIVKRLSGRRFHPASGRTYHIEFQPPRVPNCDDVTGEPLVQREDDSEATIIKRLNVYHDQTEPLVAWYRQKSAILGTQYVSLDGTAPVDVVSSKILDLIRAV